MDLESAIIRKLTFIDDRVDIDDSHLTPIQEFYKDAKIFITGCTGFLGNILVEKLLRSCPVSTLYLLVRKKKGKDMDTRLKEIFEDPLFVRMKKACPNYRKKIVILEGDCTLPGLGLSPQDKKTIINEVDIVFHMAATVRFDEILGKAVLINVRATRDLTLLVQQIKQLKSFVHVSTSYSNCTEDQIEEKIYPTPIHYEHILEISEILDEQLLKNLTPHFLGKYPNTYAYTKQIAEGVVQQEGTGLPAGIYRPAIVVSTYKEPIAGWINNIYGPTGMTVGSALGLIRVMYLDVNAYSNIVPVDMTVNGLIASAWDVAKRFEKAKEENTEFEIPVYHFESNSEKSLSWRYFEQLTAYYGPVLPSLKCMWIYILFPVNSYPLYLVMDFFLHVIPGAIVDSILYVSGKKPMLIKIYRKGRFFQGLLRYFNKTFIYKSYNVRKMLGEMCQKDREVFFCDLRDLKWEEFFMTYLSGARLYLVKDPIDTLEEGKKHWKKLRWAHRTLVTLSGLLAATLLWFSSYGLYQQYTK